MSVEERFREAVQARAAAIEVEERPWSEVLLRVEGRRRKRRMRSRLALACVTVLLIALGITALTGRSPTTPSETVGSIRHVPTGDTILLAHGVTQAGNWELIHFQTSHGPCIGIQATEPHRRAPTVPRGWPHAAVQCAPDIDLISDALFLMSLRTSSSQQEPFLVGMTTRGTRQLRVRVDGTLETTVVPIQLEGGLAGFALPLPPGARSVDVRRDGQEPALAHGLSVVPHNDTPVIVVGTSGDRIVSAYYDGAGRICVVVRQRGQVLNEFRWCPAPPKTAAPVPPPAGVTSFDVAGAVSVDVEVVHLIGFDDRPIATVPTFGCNAGFPACFFHALVDQPVAHVVGDR